MNTMDVLEPTPRLRTREEYDKIAKASIFHPSKHVQLIEGKIVTRSPQDSPHFREILIHIASGPCLCPRPIASPVVPPLAGSRPRGCAHYQCR